MNIMIDYLETEELEETEEQLKPLDFNENHFEEAMTDYYDEIEDGVYRDIEDGLYGFHIDDSSL